MMHCVACCNGTFVCVLAGITNTTFTSSCSRAGLLCIYLDMHMLSFALVPCSCTSARLWFGAACAYTS